LNPTGCKTGDFPSPVKRPAYSALSKAKLRRMGLSIPSWQDALPRCVHEGAQRDTTAVPPGKSHRLMIVA